MKILLVPFHYFPTFAAGGEIYIHHLAKGLLSLGHEIKCLVACPGPYEYEGIECIPIGRQENLWLENNDQFAWCDVVVMQLLGNAYSYNKAKQHNKKLMFIAHNTSKHYFVYPQTGIIYNSNTLANLNLYPLNKSTVLQPLTPMAKQVKSGSKIVLINCNENKGGKILVELAKMLPQYKFAGIKGMYGTQIIEPSLNLTYRENGWIDWSDIKLLIVPSETESWSMAATEAIMRGIPVLCSDLPGIRENLSYAGVYIDRKFISLYAESTIKLMTDSKEQVKLCLQRAKELDPKPRLLEFEKWLIEFVNN